MFPILCHLSNHQSSLNPFEHHELISFQKIVPKNPKCVSNVSLTWLISYQDFCPGAVIQNFVDIYCCPWICMVKRQETTMAFFLEKWLYQDCPRPYPSAGGRGWNGCWPSWSRSLPKRKKSCVFIFLFIFKSFDNQCIIWRAETWHFLIIEECIMFSHFFKQIVLGCTSANYQFCVVPDEIKSTNKNVEQKILMLMSVQDLWKIM